MNAKDYYIECASAGIEPTEEGLLAWLDDEREAWEWYRAMEQDRLEQQGK
jgi:hypothetical protein